MREPFHTVRQGCLIAVLFSACGTGDIEFGGVRDGVPPADGGTTNSIADAGSEGADSGTQSSDQTQDAGTPIPVTDDPFPTYCGPPGGGWTVPPAPTGTVECPSDKNIEGCPCTELGQSAPCWPGKRANRNRGICQDGVTTCQTTGAELGQRVWGKCENAILPVPGATLGKNACTCFSSGTWKLSNMSPCFVEGSNKSMVSTFMNGATPQCNWPFQAQGRPFSENTLTVDCEGQFQLCFTLKAGDANNPQPSDCIIASVCSEAWYGQQGMEQPMPALPAWTSNNSSCNEAFKLNGYAEMSVRGKSVFCEDVPATGVAHVFKRIRYCPFACTHNPSLPECSGCSNGGSGSF